MITALAAVMALGQNCAPLPAQANFPALPSGTLMQGIGSSDLVISSDSERARRLARQGFALIHAFWFNEAVRSFRNAVESDPKCASAWLGLHVAMTLPWHQIGGEEADYAIRQAVRFSGEASDLEQSLIAAFRTRSLGRSSEYERAMAELFRRYPRASEPRLLYAGIRTQQCLMNGIDADGQRRGVLTEVAALIKPILDRDPDSAAAHHYWIHSHEGTDPRRALGSADKIGRLAPGAGHLVHMAGHIYNRLGMFDEAQASFDASLAVDEAYGRKLASGPDSNWNYAHNLRFMELNLSEMGRLSAARRIADKFGRDHGRIFWRAGDWSNLIKTSGRAGLSEDYVRGWIDLADGRIEEAVSRSIRLLDVAGVSASGTQVQRPKHSSGRVIEALDLRASVLARLGRLREAEVIANEAADAFRNILYEEPPSFIRPPQENFGFTLLRAGQYDSAAGWFRRSLVEMPNSGWALFGIGVAHERAGRPIEAKAVFQQFLQVWSKADVDLYEIRYARQFVGS